MKLTTPLNIPSLAVVLEVVGVEGVAVEAELVEDAVTELGPLVDEQFGRVAPGLPRPVPPHQELVGERHEVSGLAASLCQFQ